MRISLTKDSREFYKQYFTDVARPSRLYSDAKRGIDSSVSNDTIQGDAVLENLYDVLGSNPDGDSPIAQVYRKAYESISKEIPEEIREFIEEYGFGAAIGSCVLGETVAHIIEEAARDADDDGGEGGDEGEDESEGSGEGSGGGGSYQEASKGSRRAADRIIEALEKNASRNSAYGRQAATELDRQIDGAENIHAMVKGSGSGPGFSCEALDAARNMGKSRHLRGLFPLIGRLATHFNGAFSRAAKEGRSIPEGTETSDELQYLTAIEQLKRRSPRLRKLFLAQLAEHSLVVKNMTGYDTARDGNVIVLVDESGSMTSNCQTGESYVVVSKAVAYAAVVSAGKRGRKATIIPFDGYAYDPIVFNRGISGPVSAGRMAGYLGQFHGGGTSWQAALNKAFPLLDDNTDILLITDGADWVDGEFVQRFVEKMAKTDSRLFVVLIGYDQDSIRTDGFCYSGSEEQMRLAKEVMFANCYGLLDTNPDSIHVFSKLFSDGQGVKQ